MYFDGSDPCWVPVLPYGIEQDWRLRKAQYGDGYEQRILDGINALNLKWQVSFPNLPQVKLLDMDSYLTSMKAAAFPFTDPVTELTYSVFCDAWSISWDVKRKKDPVTLNYQFYGTLSAEFVRANGVQIGPII